ncbi:MAG: VOC family protein [Candidatus Hodarchaeales archaeon]
MINNRKKDPVLAKYSKIDQIGIVVQDVEATLKIYKEMFGVEPFWTLESAINSAKLKIGLFYFNEIQMELIQVLEGTSIHSTFLEQRGEGLHHLGFFIDDIQLELAYLEKCGINVLQRGMVLEMVKFAYLDTEKSLGIILELIQFD